MLSLRAKGISRLQNKLFRRNKRCKSIIAGVMALTLLSATQTVVAQLAGKGGLNGRVIDATGAVVPNASVEIIQVSTNTRQSSTTTGAGEYSFSLDPGK